MAKEERRITMILVILALIAGFIFNYVFLMEDITCYPMPGQNTPDQGCFFKTEIIRVFLSGLVIITLIFVLADHILEREDKIKKELEQDMETITKKLKGDINK